MVLAVQWSVHQAVVYRRCSGALGPRPTRAYPRSGGQDRAVDISKRRWQPAEKHPAYLYRDAALLHTSAV